MITEIHTQSMKSAAKRKRGFTLTEIAIVLGIIGLILGAIWAAASSVYANLKANQAQQGILAAAQAVRSLYATSANTGVTVSTVITTPGMFPTSWASQAVGATAGTTGNPWHINPTVSFSYVIGNGSAFAVEVDGISDTGCAQLIGFYSTAAAGSNGGQVPGLVGNKAFISTATVTGSATTPQIGATTGTATAVAFTSTPASCSGGKLLDNVAITFDMAIM